MILLQRFSRPFDVCIFTNQPFHALRYSDIGRQRFQHHGNDEISPFFNAQLPGDLQFKLTPYALEEIPAEYDDGFPAGFDRFQYIPPRSDHRERNHARECRVGI